MTARSWYLIGMLALLFLANLAMLMGMTNWPMRERFVDLSKKTVGSGSGSGVKVEGFADAGGVVDVGAIASKPVSFKKADGILEPFEDLNMHVGAGAQSVDEGIPMTVSMPGKPTVKALGLGAATPPPAEGFLDYLSNGFGTAPIGSYDGVNMAAGLMNPINQGFKKDTPNEPLAGPPVEIGPDNLFYFKNNQCKPECCGSTLACDGGCVCTDPSQRNFINTRGGNRGPGDI
jgi:hypothetical protein